MPTIVHDVSLPQPLTPPDCDLTDFKFMPLEVARLRRSKAWLICKRRPDLAFFMLNLWSVSWHERPAASLEDDDDVLADAAMCPPDKWPKVRAEVLRGWVKCSDGRWYHPVVAEKALDSWYGRIVQRWEKECDRVRKDNKRRAESGLPSADLPPRPERKSIGHVPDFHRTSDGIPPENALKGEGREREREREGTQSEDGAGIPADAETEAEFEIWYAAYPRHKSRGAAVRAYRTARKKADAETLLGGARRYAGDMAGKEQRYIKHPPAWLNGECWLDEADAGGDSDIPLANGHDDEDDPHRTAI